MVILFVLVLVNNYNIGIFQTKRRYVRVVKETDSKSVGLCLRRFESCCRRFLFSPEISLEKRQRSKHRLITDQWLTLFLFFIYLFFSHFLLAQMKGSSSHCSQGIKEHLLLQVILKIKFNIFPLLK